LRPKIPTVLCLVLGYSTLIQFDCRILFLGIYLEWGHDLLQDCKHWKEYGWSQLSTAIEISAS
jgi:hypothetical protein